MSIVISGGAQSAEPGYVVRAVPGGVQVSIGPVPVDQAKQLRLPLRLGPVRLSGLPSEDHDAIASALQPKIPRQGTASDLFAAAQLLETEMRDRGYALARAYVPPQRLRGGDPVRIDIINVQIEALDLDALPPALAIRARERLRDIIGRSFLRSADLTRMLGMLQLDTGMVFRVEPCPGSSAERIKLRVFGPTRSWSGEANLGGMASRPFSHILASGIGSIMLPEDAGRLTIAGTLGRRAQPEDSNGPLGTGLALWTIPLDTTSGAFTEIGVVGMGLRTSSSSTSMTTAYDYGRMLWRFGQPLAISSDETLILKVGPDLTAESFRLGTSVPFSLKDETTTYTGVMRAEAIWVRQFMPGVSVEASGTGTIGFTQSRHRIALVGDAASETDGHAIGVLSARARTTIALPLDGILAIQTRAQYSGLGALPISEQFQLFRAGDTTVYDPETDQGESGATVRAELGRPFGCEWIQNGTVLTPYVFGGIGVVRTIESFDTQRTIVGRTWGVGSRLALPADSILPGKPSLGIELYRQTSSGTVPNYTGLSLNLSTKF